VILFLDSFAIAPRLQSRVVIGPAVMATIWRMTFDDASPLDLQRFMKAHLDLVLNGPLKP
jgi:hypothetical protein